jgi:hypothetical protein
MRGPLIFIALAFATNLAAQDMSAVYARYRSGRPRLVVKVTQDPDELLLLRYADVPNADPRVIDREEMDAKPLEVRVEKVIDAKDVVVWMAGRHDEPGIVDRVIDNRLVRIADDYGEAVDLDGDGVPEVIAIGFGGQNECGVYSYVDLQHWNGKRYVGDKRHYVTAFSAGVGHDDEVLLSESKRYVVRLFGRGRVRFDGKTVTPGKPFETEEGCHTIALQNAGPKTRLFLEELP